MSQIIKLDLITEATSALDQAEGFIRQAERLKEQLKTAANAAERLIQIADAADQLSDTMFGSDDTDVSRRRRAEKLTDRSRALEPHYF